MVVLVVAKVEVKEVVVRRCVCGPSKRFPVRQVLHLANRNGAVVVFTSTSVVPSRLETHEKLHEIMFIYFI